MYYESKKDVKRQVYENTSHTFDAILLTGRDIFELAHQCEGEKSPISLLLYSFI